MANPNVCVLKTDGTNCDEEMAHAFEVAGATPEFVHVNQLRSGERRLDDFSILALSGGFSYGDDIASGKILANELTSFLSDQIRTFTTKERPVLGVCNGFQVLVRSGLLPSGELGTQEVTLTDNTKGRFDCRWIDLAVGYSVCRFASAYDYLGTTIPMQTAHAEGMFYADQSVIDRLHENGLIVYRYAKPEGTAARQEEPFNPNGSLDDIAGICDPSGTILGMMPHPERSVEAFHPDRSRTEVARLAANRLFKNIVEYEKEM
jgi:phosphoribosylformylglycinamidine synthase subunit PurQ / glutaminase